MISSFHSSHIQFRVRSLFSCVAITQFAHAFRMRKDVLDLVINDTVFISQPYLYKYKNKLVWSVLFLDRSGALFHRLLFIDSRLLIGRSSLLLHEQF